MTTESLRQLGDSSQQAFSWPPGFAGYLAYHIYRNSYTPVQKVAITAALGALAGVCGRAYRTHTGMDLALYMILVARSGIGKDAIHTGIPNLIRTGGVRDAERFVRKTDFASGPALHKEILRSPGFLNLQGEFGRKLKGMADERNGVMQAFRTVLTDAYGKQFLDGKEYSDSEKSMVGVEWPALSFLGETTPGTFLESLTDGMMEDGFMSRFLTMWYEGDRPQPNEGPAVPMLPEVAANWKALLQHAVRYQLPLNMPAAINVGFKNEDAYAKLKSFELDCIARINATTDEADRQTYNRAHLKALKLAGLLAVGDHYLFPTIGLDHAAWALSIVREDIDAFRRRKAAGLVGDGDHARERLVRSWIEEYLTRGASPGYRVPPEMREDGIVPRKYLQMRTSDVHAFTRHRLQASGALDLTLKALIESGYIMEEQKDKTVQKYAFHGRCYRVLTLT